MRTVSEDSSVRLYHLDEAEGGAATTLFYGTLADALACAAAQPDAVQDGLFLQTADDIVGYREFLDG